MKVSALGVEEQRVWVVVDLDEDEAAYAALGDGYRVEVRVVLWQSDEVLRVPTSALFRAEDGSWAAFAVVDGRTRLTPVEVDHRNGQWAEVTDGLSAGDRVVVHPPEEVADGTRVAEREV
jgi:HlyD family secretion protein